MSIANSATCHTPRRPAPIAALRPAAATPAVAGPAIAVAAGPAVGLTKHSSVRACSLPAICRPASPHDDPAIGWQVREEEGEYDIPDLLKDRDYEPDAVLYDAAHAHTEGQREAMALLDDAENLLEVLLASIEQEGDSRAMQAEAVLKVVKEKLSKAHTRIDRQEARHRNLFLAYFELEARFGKEAD